MEAMGTPTNSLQALLDEVMVGTENPPASPPPQSWPLAVAKPAIQKIRYTHDAMIDLMIQEPWVSQNELARHFGYSASWISTMMASDMFQMRLAERREELIDPAIRITIEERTKGLVLRSLEIMAEKLSKPSAEIPDNLALRAFEVSSRAAGYGARDTVPQTKVDVNIHLEQLGDNLTKLLQRRKASITYEGSDEKVFQE